MANFLSDIAGGISNISVKKRSKIFAPPFGVFTRAFSNMQFQLDGQERSASDTYGRPNKKFHPIRHKYTWETSTRIKSMAEPTEYTFDLREVATALVRQQGLKEGLWMLAFEFNFDAGVFGPSTSNAKPSALLSINRLKLVKPEKQDKNLPFLVDASAINPNSTVISVEKPQKKR